MKFSELKHKHKLVLCGSLQGEYGGSYPLYWCNECGMLVELFVQDTCAVMIPSMTRKVAENARGVEYVPSTRRSAPSDRVLGRTLKDLMGKSSSNRLAEVFKLHGK